MSQQRPRLAWREAVTRFLATPPVDVPSLTLTPQPSVIDNVFPPEQCDLEHADRAMTRGSNMVPDERWGGVA